MSGLSDLTADAILAQPDLRTKAHVEPVDVPEWGGRVFVRELTAAERDQWEESVHGKEKPDTANYRARFVAITCCDSAGKLLFKPEQAVELGNKAALPIMRIFNAARELNPPLSEAVKVEKKGSAETPSDGSATDSP